jgi:hypothetical protein
MTRWKYLLALVIAFATPVLSTVSSSALPPSVSHKIYIRARVLPTHTIILDRQGNIQQIISNTTGAADVIKVFVGKAAPDTVRPLTPELYTAYLMHSHEADGKIGTIYQAPPLTALVKSNNFMFETIQKQSLVSNAKKLDSTKVSVRY